MELLTLISRTQTLPCAPPAVLLPLALLLGIVWCNVKLFRQGRD